MAENGEKAVARRGLIDRLGRKLEHPAVLPGVLFAGIVFVIAIVIPATRNDKLVAYDAHAYYQAAALQDPYRATILGGFDAVGGLYEYKYPPPLAQALAPFRAILTWPEFLAIWSALLYGVFVVMGGRWDVINRANDADRVSPLSGNARRTVIICGFMSIFER